MSGPGEVVPLFPQEDEDVPALLAEGFLLLRALPPGDYLSRALEDLRAIAADPRMAGALAAGALRAPDRAAKEEEHRVAGRIVRAL